MKGELMHLTAQYNATPDQANAVRHAYPIPLSGEAPIVRIIRAGTVYRAADVEAEPEWRSRTEEIRNANRARGVRSQLAVPMLRRGSAIGVINLTHRAVGAFSDAHVELVKTFADQAVIAIENVRLFKELQASNRELATALDTQTATSDILRVISASRTDAQPVFDAIVANAVRLLGAYMSALTRRAGDRIELAAFTGIDDAGAAALKARFPMSLHAEGSHARA